MIIAQQVCKVQSEKRSEDLEYLEPYFNRERGCYWDEALAPYETSELLRLTKLSSENIESIKHGSKPGFRSKLLLNQALDILDQRLLEALETHTEARQIR